MKLKIHLLVALFSLNAMAANFELSRPSDAQLGFPTSVEVESLDLVQLDIFRAPVARIRYRTQSQTLRSVELPVTKLSQYGDRTQVRVVLQSAGEYGGSCGPRDLSQLLLEFEVDATLKTYALSLSGTREQTSDSCHIAVKTDHVAYELVQ